MRGLSRGTSTPLGARMATVVKAMVIVKVEVVRKCLFSVIIFHNSLTAKPVSNAPHVSQALLVPSFEVAHQG